MKAALIFSAIILFASLHSNSQVDSVKVSSDDAEHKSGIYHPPANEGTGIAKVNRINGIDVYCFSEPLVKYSIVFTSGDLLSDADIKSLFFGGLVRANVNEKMMKLVNAAHRKARNTHLQFDAIIYSGGNRPVAIRYVDANVDARMLAKVNKINGVDVYVLAEPAVAGYSTINTAKAKSGGFVSMATVGIVNSSIEDDIAKLVNRLKGNKRKKIDAIVYSGGKTGTGIRFN